MLRVVGGEVELEDLGSSNGTFVNGERLSAPRTIRPTDRLEVGNVSVQLLPVTQRHAAMGTMRLQAIKAIAPEAEQEFDTTELINRREALK